MTGAWRPTWHHDYTVKVSGPITAYLELFEHKGKLYTRTQWAAGLPAQWALVDGMPTPLQEMPAGCVWAVYQACECPDCADKQRP